MKTDKVTQLVLRLIKITRQNEIKWSAVAPYKPELLNGDIIVDKMYFVTLSNGRFRLFKYKSKYWIDDFRFEWSQSIRLELIDRDGNSEYEFPYENSMSDLYDVVRQQVSNISSILDEILGLTLTVIEAKYFTETKSADVTEIVSNLVKNNRLNILAGNELFGDPDPGTPKKLEVLYKYSGETRQVLVNEGETMDLP